jgi:hypothetical protein
LGDALPGVDAVPDGGFVVDSDGPDDDAAGLLQRTCRALG